MYYGLENGLCLGYWFSGVNSLPHLVYREPGFTYPATSDTDTGTNTEKDLYYNECVSGAGKTQNCTMHKEDQYIFCIDECALIKCNDTISQTVNCSALEGKEFAECESSISWCEHYEIKIADRDAEEGYIPLTYHCYNNQGAITDIPGDVLITGSRDKVAGSNCFYRDSELLVNCRRHSYYT